jgi:hypothetical protein
VVLNCIYKATEGSIEKGYEVFPVWFILDYNIENCERVDILKNWLG